MVLSLAPFLKEREIQNRIFFLIVVACLAYLSKLEKLYLLLPYGGGCTSGKSHFAAANFCNLKPRSGNDHGLLKLEPQRPKWRPAPKVQAEPMLLTSSYTQNLNFTLSKLVVLPKTLLY